MPRALASRSLIAAVVLVASAAAARADFIATYTFTGSPGDQASEPVDAQPVGLMFSDITRGAGVLANAGDNSINSRAWTEADTLDADDYYQFAISPTAGLPYSLSGLDF